MSITKINKVQAGEGIWTSDNLVAGTNISITQVEKPVIDSNTVALWHLDGNLSSALEGGNQFWSSTGSYAAGKFGQGLSYSSGNRSSYIQVPNYTSSQNYTVDFWIKLLQNNTKFWFYNSGSSYRTEFTNSSVSFAAFSFESNYPNGTDIYDWTHFAFVNDYSNGKTYIFINGKKLMDKNIVDAPLSPTTCSIQYYGSIDEFRVSNVARWTEDFTPYSEPYGHAGGAAQYQINNTKADPDLSSYLQNKTTASNSLLLSLKEPASATGTNSIAITNSSSNPKNNGSYSVVMGDGYAYYSNVVAIGYQAQAASNYCTSIGNLATASGGSAAGKAGTAIGNAAAATYGTAIGAGTNASSKAIVVGVGNGISQKVQATAYKAIAIGVIGETGELCEATANEAIQLGNGANANAKTFQVFNYQLLDANGKIPSARLEVTRQKYTNVTGTTLATGLILANYSTILVYKNGMLFDETDDYTISTNDIEFNVALESTDKINIIAM